MEFLSFARSHGLLMEYTIQDGRVHRVPTEAKPRRRNGAYQYDGASGWVQDWTIHERAIAFRSSHPAPALRVRPPVIDYEAERAAAKCAAQQIIARCFVEQHPYLKNKGFPIDKAFVDRQDSMMVVPMHIASRYGEIVSVQRISADGEKRFLRSGAAKDAVFHLGRGPDDFLVEGYATALSVRAALSSMYRKARVVVCFSAGNLARVARFYPRGTVVADNDVSGAGEAAARASGLRWVMPTSTGDANDLHQSDGLGAVCAMING